jgi:hypothetical protein
MVEDTEAELSDLKSAHTLEISKLKLVCLWLWCLSLLFDCLLIYLSPYFIFFNFILHSGLSSFFHELDSN